MPKSLALISPPPGGHILQIAAWPMCSDGQYRSCQCHRTYIVNVSGDSAEQDRIWQAAIVPSTVSSPGPVYRFGRVDHCSQGWTTIGEFRYGKKPNWSGIAIDRHPHLVLVSGIPAYL